jgi:ATP:cob(I)alamin adenosyltransferase
VRKIKVYTRTGDKGKSSLYNGDRAAKDSAIFAALGDVDELNATIGVAREFCAIARKPSDDASESAAGEASALADVQTKLEEVQSRLMDVGTAIATPPKEGMAESKAAIAAFADSHASDLETWIDSMETELPPLRNFILPSGGMAASHLHVARATCRRAERAVVPLVREGVTQAAVGIYLNRLSDALFVAARLAAKREGRAEVTYQKARA